MTKHTVRRSSPLYSEMGWVYVEPIVGVCGPRFTEEYQAVYSAGITQRSSVLNGLPLGIAHEGYQLRLEEISS